MFRGILRAKSKDINNFQRIIDLLVTTLIFGITLSNNNIFSNLNYLFVFFIYALILNSINIYESYRVKNIINIFPKIIFVSSTLTIVSIFFTELIFPINNVVILEFFSLLFVYLCIHHLLIRYFLRKIRSKGYNSRNALFIGNKEHFQVVQKQLKEFPWLGYKIRYWFSTHSKDYNEACCDGGINDLESISKIKDIDKVFFSHDDSDEIKFNKILKILGDLCIEVSYIVDWKISSLSLQKEYFGEIFALNIWNPEDSLLNQKIKRLFDVIISVILLFFLSPLFVLIMIAIKVSSKGSIIFKQKRYGLNGKEFNMYKFRTMYIKSNQLIQAKLNDKRVTKVGKFLRKYSLDEFPQLINVIKGEMSLVGPRPHAIEHNEYYRKFITGYMQRHSKLPGMTGLAQINGARGETKNIKSMKLRVKYDIEYNNNWSLRKDLVILTKTFFYIFKGEAY